MSSFTPMNFRRGKAPRRKLTAAKRSYAAKKIQRKVRSNQTKRIKKVIRSMKEPKHCPECLSMDIYQTYTALNVSPRIPSPIPGVFNGIAGGAAAVSVLQVGQYLSPPSTAVNTALGATTCTAIGGTSMKQGSSRTTIDGAFAIQKSSQLNLRVSCNYVRNTAQLEEMMVPIEFRLLVVSAKPHNDSQEQSLSGGLFRDYKGTPIGLNGTILTTSGLMDQYTVNSNQWTTHREVRFKLNNPIHQSSTAGDESFLQQCNYLQPSHSFTKNVVINFPVAKSKKLKFNQSTVLGVNDWEPMNKNMTYYVVVLACRPFGATFNNLQNASVWTLTGQMKSSFVDI